MFATRSPHRPNFIGLSCVKLESIHGLSLMISGHDLLDGTPILDIKPYLNYADSLVSARQGWLEDLPQRQEIVFEWSLLANAQLDYLSEVWNCTLKASIEHRLSQSPVPYPNHRVKQINDEQYELAYRTWRVRYTWKQGLLSISSLSSGYDQETLMGQKPSRWDDLPMHQAFVKMKF